MTLRQDNSIRTISDFLKCTWLMFLGLGCLLAFPTLAYELIDFFYDLSVRESTHLSVPDGSSSELIIFIMVVLFQVVLCGWLYLRNLRGKLDKSWQVFLASFLAPILAYGYVTAEVFSAKNKSVGLYLMVMRNDENRFPRLLRIGADPNIIIEEGNPNRHSVLIVAGGLDRANFVAKLIKHGAHRHYKNSNGETGKDIALKRGYLKTAAMFDMKII